jgi:hypothetical protein
MPRNLAASTKGFVCLPMLEGSIWATGSAPVPSSVRRSHIAQLSPSVVPHFGRVDNSVRTLPVEQDGPVSNPRCDARRELLQIFG